MLKIALIASAIIASAGTAFAGSDHYGNSTGYQPPVAVDQSPTASVTISGAYKNIDTMTKTGAKSNTVAAPDRESGQGIWGH